MKICSTVKLKTSLLRQSFDSKISPYTIIFYSHPQIQKYVINDKNFKIIVTNNRKIYEFFEDLLHLFRLKQNYKLLQHFDFNILNVFYRFL